MTDNEKLARWLGWKEGYGIKVVSPSGTVFTSLPDYLNDDAAAMRLLDALVEKGYAVAIASRGREWDIGVARDDCDLDYCISMVKPTRREAVVAACLELIEKEASHDV